MFYPGKQVKKFFSRKDREIIIRYPKWGDVAELTNYINRLSAEDTFVNFSGEKVTKEDEAQYLSNRFLIMEKGDGVTLGGFYGNQLVRLTQIDRNTKARKRERHTASLGLSVAQDFREQGIGFELARAAIEEAKKHISGLRLIVLTVFSINEKAINLYKKLGFKEYGRLLGGIYYRGDYIDKVEMALVV